MKTVVCVDCGKQWRIRADRNAKRCRQCVVKWMNETRSSVAGKGNPNWKGGIDKNQYAKLRRKDRKLWAIAYKGGKCQRCGVEDLIPACYHFHHVSEKGCQVSHMIGCNIDRIKVELKKCILVCANCHITIHRRSR